MGHLTGDNNMFPILELSHWSSSNVRAHHTVKPTSFTHNRADFIFISTRQKLRKVESVDSDANVCSESNICGGQCWQRLTFHSTIHSRKATANCTEEAGFLQNYWQVSGCVCVCVFAGRRCRFNSPQAQPRPRRTHSSWFSALDVDEITNCQPAKDVREDAYCALKDLCPGLFEVLLQSP